MDAIDLLLAHYSPKPQTDISQALAEMEKLDSFSVSVNGKAVGFARGSGEIYYVDINSRRVIKSDILALKFMLIRTYKGPKTLIMENRPSGIVLKCNDSVFNGVENVGVSSNISSDPFGYLTPFKTPEPRQQEIMIEVPDQWFSSLVNWFEEIINERN